MSKGTIKFIIGKAGTAKTTTLIQTVNTLLNQNKTVAIIAFTHQAVNNIVEKFSTVDKTNNQNSSSTSSTNLTIKTIHSYFRITPDHEYEFDIDNFIDSVSSFGYNTYSLHKKKFDSLITNSKIKRKINLPDYLFVDELSLIPDVLLQIIFSFCRYSNLVLIGDLLQLNPVSKNKNPINVNALQLLTDFNCTFHEALLISQHLSNNIFIYKEYQESSKMIMTKNYRSNTEVQQIIDEVLGDYTNYQHYYFNDYEHIDDYTILSSKYKYLKLMYSKTFHTGTIRIQTMIGNIKVNENDLMILTTNINDEFVNGDIVQIVSEKIIRKKTDPEIQHMFSSEETILPLLPYNYLTIHKSQGLGFKKVLIILDDMFEITMLYTALTRAREDIKFIVFKQENIEHLKLYTEAFKKLTKIIYK